MELELLTVREAARILQVSEQTVRRLLAAREITHYCIGIAGGAIRIARRDLDEFIQRRKD